MTLNPLVSLIGRFVAYTARIVIDTHTDRPSTVTLAAHARRGLIMQLLYIQVNKKFCELKRGNIGIVEKAQETRFGLTPKYSRYIGIAS